MAVARQIVDDRKETSGVQELHSDADVVALLGARQFEPALHVLMKRYGTAIYSYCICNIRDLALAEDTHQQVFIQVFRDLPRLRDAERVKIWLFAIARNRVLDAIKKRRRADHHLETAADIDTPDPASAETRVDKTRLHNAFLAALAQIDDASRAAVLLRYQQGLTFPEISEICGEKPGTLQARVQRALPRLSTFIEALLGPF